MSVRLALAGYKLSGKTTCARFIKELLEPEYTYYLHFKDSLINILRAGILSVGVPFPACDFGDEKIDEARDLLVALGNYLRLKDRDIIVKLLERSLERIPGDANVVVDGLRMLNEVPMLRGHGFKIIKIGRPGYGSDGARTEIEQAEIEADYTIRNDKGIDELKDTVAVIVRKEKSNGKYCRNERLTT